MAKPAQGVDEIIATEKTQAEANDELQSQKDKGFVNAYIKVADGEFQVWSGVTGGEFEGFPTKQVALNDALARGASASEIEYVNLVNGNIRWAFKSAEPPLAPGFSVVEDPNTGDKYAFNTKAGRIEGEPFFVKQPGVDPTTVTFIRDEQEGPNQVRRFYNIGGQVMSVAYDPSQPTKLAREDISLVQQWTNKDGTKTQLYSYPGGTFQRVVPAGAPSLEELAAFRPIDTNGDGVDDFAVFADGQRIALGPPVVDPANAQIASSIDLGGGRRYVTFNTGQSLLLDPAQGTASVSVEPTTGKVMVTQPDGTVSFPAALNQELASLQSVNIGGQQFAFSPETGAFQQVQQRFESGVVVEGGREFLRDVQGNLQPLQPEQVASLDELISGRLIAGDAEGALALADFRDRPTSLQAFQAAMDFAQSPGDVAAISAIARGQSLVAPPPAGGVQRIAEQPEFLQDAYARLMNQMKGGTGTPGAFMDVLNRISQEDENRKKELEAVQKENEGLKAAQNQADIAKQISDAIDAALGGITGGGTARGGKTGGGAEADFVAGLLPGTVTFTKGTQTVSTRDPAQIAELMAAGFTQGAPTATPSGTSDGALRTIPTPTPQPGGMSATEQTVAGFNLPDFSPGFNNVSLPKAPAPASTPTSPQVPFTREAFESAGGFSETELTNIFGQKPKKLARGGFVRGLGLVGEKGPELVFSPQGSMVMPMGKTKDMRKMREAMNVKPLQRGGTVDPLLPGRVGIFDEEQALLPFGVRQALSGRPIEPTRRRLSTAAGLPILSLQAQRNLLPEELEVFDRLRAEAGIPLGAFQQEVASGIPGFNVARRPARFAPGVVR